MAKTLIYFALAVACVMGLAGCGNQEQVKTLKYQSEQKTGEIQSLHAKISELEGKLAAVPLSTNLTPLSETKIVEKPKQREKKADQRVAISNEALTSDSANSDQVDDLESKVLAKTGEIEELENKVSDLEDVLGSIKRQVRETRSAFDNLSSKVDDFSDGFSNWRDVLGDVQSEVSNVDSEVSDLERLVRGF